jgi:hypothetical protein
MKIINGLEIEYYSVCACGAITLYGANGQNISMRPVTKKKLGIDLRGVKRLNKGKTYACDHCSNRWGIDLCACGSGKHPEKCDCGCNENRQSLLMLDCDYIPPPHVFWVGRGYKLTSRGII